MKTSYLDTDAILTTIKSLKSGKVNTHSCIGNNKVVLNGSIRYCLDSLGEHKSWKTIIGNMPTALCKELKLICLFCNTRGMSNLLHFRGHLGSKKHKRKVEQRANSLGIGALEISICKLCGVLLFGGIKVEESMPELKKSKLSEFSSKSLLEAANSNIVESEGTCERASQINKNAPPPPKPIEMLIQEQLMLLKEQSFTSNTPSTSKTNNVSEAPHESICSEMHLKRGDDKLKDVEEGVEKGKSTCPTQVGIQISAENLDNTNINDQPSTSKQYLSDLSSVNSECSEVISVDGSDHDVECIGTPKKVVIHIGDSDSDSVEYVRDEKKVQVTINISDEGIDHVDHSRNHNCISNSFLLSSFTQRDVMRRTIQDKSFLRDQLNEINENTLTAVCRLCNSGEVSGWVNFIGHLLGNKHDKLERQEFHSKRGSLKIVICKLCAKINYYYDAFGSREHIKYNGSLKSIIDGVENNKIIYDDQDEKSNRKILKPSRDVSFYIFIRGIDHKLDFLSVFQGVQSYGESRSLSIHYLYVDWRNHLVICCFKKRRHASVPDWKKCIISRRVYSVSQLSPESALQYVRHCENSSFWKDGDMSPECLMILKDPQKLLDRVSSSLNEMYNTTLCYQKLTDYIAQDLHGVMTRFYDVQSIDFFGSRTTGTAVADSDFDIALVLNENFYEDSINISRVADAIGADKLRTFRISNVIKFAKVPIVKVTHMKTKSKCDISLNNLGGVYNSLLTRFYLDWDTRVRWLVSFIKDWALLNNIRGSFKITSYGLTWLVMFFLMQKENPLVPPVCLLTNLPGNQRLQPKFSPYSFLLQHNVVRQWHNSGPAENFSELQLLYSFFKFYSRFDFKQAIFTFSGQSVNRSSLLHRPPPLLGPVNINEQKVFNFSLIVVDPIDHYVNITPAADKETTRNFQKLCSLSLTLMEDYMQSRGTTTKANDCLVIS